MRFHSVKKQSPSVSFREALFNGLAPDGGLYVPEFIPNLDERFISQHQVSSLHTIGAEVLSQFIDDIPRNTLADIVRSAWDFPIPLVPLEQGIYLLELFHGPTLAFKDVGARFMAHAMSYFLAEDHRDLTIVVATSGDTGSAVAHGFFNVPHIQVFILYPSGKISPLQEKQMTTLGGNIVALEVEGTFDDCQLLVKKALSDRDQHRALTTANSINLGRLLPQIVYYMWGLTQLQKQLGRDFRDPTIVVPSGNFGNLTAAVYAKWMGAPIGRLVAATNANDVASEFLQRGAFTAHPSIQTFSNAMDVGNPSNIARLQALYDNELPKRDISAVRIDDKETLQEIRNTFERTGRVLDPHTAVGVAAARRIQSGLPTSLPIIVAATAHPAKFQSVVKEAIGVDVPLPNALRATLDLPKQSRRMKAEYSEFREALENSC